MEDCVIFWNTSSGEKHAKTVRNLVAIDSCKDLCVLAAKVDIDSSQVSQFNAPTAPYHVMLIIVTDHVTMAEYL